MTKKPKPDGIDEAWKRTATGEGTVDEALETTIEQMPDVEDALRALDEHKKKRKRRSKRKTT